MGNLEFDVTLVEKAKQGNKKALEELCRGSMRSVYYVALKIVKNEADAEDIMADTMVTVVEKLHTLSEPEAYISWVNRITINKCKNFLAKSKPVYLGEDEQEVLENAELENYNEEFLPEEFVLSKEKTAVLMEVIREKTTAAEMMSIMLFYYNGESIKSIAAEMNCAEITVKTRLASARKKIKNGLEEKFGKGVIFMATTGLYVLSKAMKAEAAELVVPEAVAQAATKAAAGAINAMESGVAEHAKVSASNAGVSEAKTVGESIGKEVGKEVAKKAISGKIIIGVVGVVAAVGVTIGAVSLIGNSGNKSEEAGKSGDRNGTVTEGTVEEENSNSSETYKFLYLEKGEEKSYYYANAEEDIRKYSGYQKLDLNFYHSVTCGSDADYNDFLMDIDENYVVEPGTYEYIGRKNEEYFVAQTEKDTYGIIDYKGSVVIPFEYSKIDYYDSDNDNGVIFYIAQTLDKKEYVLLSENGTEILKSDKKISSTSVDTYKAHTSDSVDTLLYEGNLYSLKNGEKLLSGLDEGTYYHNLYSHDGTLTIYDASFKVKEEVKDFKTSGFGTDEEGRTVIYSTPGMYLNEKYELAEVEKESIDKTKHVLANGKTYTSNINKEEKLIYFYDESGKELYTVPFDGWQITEVDSWENYLIINKGGRVIHPENGEVLVQGVGGFTENEKNEIVKAYLGTTGSQGYVFLWDDIKLEFDSKCLFEMNENGFWVYDRTAKVAYQYDLSGKVLTELSGIEEKWTLADDCFILIGKDGKSKVISNKDGEVIFELEYTTDDVNGGGYFPYDFNKDGIGIIQLKDGFYNLEGKKLMDVTLE